MLTLQKINKEVVLLNKENDSKLNIIKNPFNNGFLVSLVTKENYFTKEDCNNDFIIRSYENKELCDLLYELYGNYFNLANKNPNRYKLITSVPPFKDIDLVNTHEGEILSFTELLYPSDKDFYENATYLGITSLLGDYKISFYKKYNRINNNIWIINDKENNCRFPELYDLYNDFFNKLDVLATKEQEPPKILEKSNKKKLFKW